MEKTARTEKLQKGILLLYLTRIVLENCIILQQFLSYSFLWRSIMAEKKKVFDTTQLVGLIIAIVALVGM